MDTHQHPVLLFDGVCNLCDGFVQFVIKRDTQAKFRFTALQSSAAEDLLQTHQYDASDLSTVILIENGQVFTHSDVALRVARRLGGLWSLFYVFTILPKAFRDGIYNWVARNRYQWFGQKAQCMIPTPELKSRFLD